MTDTEIAKLANEAATKHMHNVTLFNGGTVPKKVSKVMFDSYELGFKDALERVQFGVIKLR